MKLAFIANARIPSERANAMQTAQMCAAFASAGADVTLYYPDRRNTFAAVDLYEYYGVPRNFQTRRVPCIDWIAPNNQRHPLEQLIFMVQTFTFGAALLVSLWRSPADIYYSRDPFVLALLAFGLPQARRQMLFEAHTLPMSSLGRLFRRRVLNRVRGTVAISHSLGRLYVALGLPEASVITAPDGVELSRFSKALTKAEARARLGLPLKQKLVVYTGGLYQGRGLEELIVAIKTVEAVLVIVGGQDRQSVTRLKNYAAQAGVTNVRFEGHRPPAEVPLYLAAGDVLAMPYSRRTVAPGGVTTDWMSPLKMFEYMAASRPIVASDLPALREVLRDGENAVLVEPDNVVALADGLRCLLSEASLAQRLAAQAWCDVEAYTWDARAKTILDFVMRAHD
ncbi:MAG: glycosyltransferase family 4 protein [Chloroflexi bacterium]|nr:glycosyltransferase family 4 protein [Chloroflexota bacterium]